MMQVYVVFKDAAQLAKIEPLYAEMGGVAQRFDMRDFRELILTAQECDLPAQAHLWTDRAKAAGCLVQLPQRSPGNVAESTVGNKVLDDLEQPFAQSHTGNPADASAVPVLL